MSEETDYLKYRGKCKEFAEAWIKDNPNYNLVRGFYHCPFWGKQQHWWTANSTDGEIYDPTKNQFPSRGMGEYEEYNGMIDCEYCGKEVPETDAYFVEHHVYCSGTCYGHDVGF